MQNLRVDNSRLTQVQARRAALVTQTESLADDLFLESGTRSQEAPLTELRKLAQEGLLSAPLPSRLGGCGLGTEPGSYLPLLRTLAALGSADLALGRLYEGHVNALILIHVFGTEAQQLRAAEDACAGKLFGVWNTGDLTPMSAKRQGEALVMQGCKTFATGAGFVDRPIVTVEHHGWQMTVPRMEAPEMADAVRLDRQAWQPLGMQSSESLTIDFTGARLQADDLLGRPGDFYRDPLFRGGAIRFAAVQAGAVLRLSRAFADWLGQRGRQGDPYQIARLGELELQAQQCALWVERAAAVAEACLWPDAGAEESQRMVTAGNMTRLAVERAATDTMQRVIAGVGAHGLLRPARFERIIRDLTMYLRQPNPDGTLADVGRSVLHQDLQHYWSEAEFPALVDEPVIS